MPGRQNVVLSRDSAYAAVGAVTCNSLEAALDLARAAGDDEAFIIGGAQIYRLALEAGIVDTMYLTHVEQAFEGDTWFPEFEGDQWNSRPMFSHVADDRNEAAFTVRRYDCISLETQD